MSPEGESPEELRRRLLVAEAEAERLRAAVEGS